MRRLRKLYVTAVDVHGDRFGIEVSDDETVAVLHFSRLEAIAIVASLREEIGHSEEIRERAYSVLVGNRSADEFMEYLAEVG